MKWMSLIILILGVIFLAFSTVFAWPQDKPVTPYGDFCPRCGHYGTCRALMSLQDSKKAMTEYYSRKGLTVEIEDIRGRFIKARVKDKDEIVDIIIFDRRTGRVRSIY